MRGTVQEVSERDRSAIILFDKLFPWVVLHGGMIVDVEVAVRTEPEPEFTEGIAVVTSEKIPKDRIGLIGSDGSGVVLTGLEEVPDADD
ncbi:MAG: hypothetical protein KAJ55_00255 [Anaerolineales bacterium]|nr:hypothetical protein [Anaerolineales bacterium]